MLPELWISAWALFVAEAPVGSIASAAVVAPTNVEACSNVAPLLHDHPVLPDGDRWAVDPRFGVELEVEALTRFPFRGKKTYAAVLSCRARGAAPDSRPSKQWAVLLHQNARGVVEPGAIAPAGDEASRVEAVVPFIADVDGDGDPELGLRGTILEEHGASRVEGEAEIFIFFSKKKRALEASRLVIKKRAKRTLARDDGSIERSGIAERAHAVGKAIVIEESIHPAADDAALDRWWEESSGEDVVPQSKDARRARWNGDALELSGKRGAPRAPVFGSLSGEAVPPVAANRSQPAGNGSERSLIQSGDTELSILEGDKTIAKLPFRGRIARIVRDRSHLYAAVYVAEREDARELYLIDLTTERSKKLPRRDGEEIAQWSWSPNGAYAVYSASAGGPLVVCSMKELETWIKTGAIASSEVKLPGAKSGRVEIVRWTSNEAFEVAARDVHYRYDASTQRAVRLYEVPAD